MLYFFQLGQKFDQELGKEEKFGKKGKSVMQAFNLSAEGWIFLLSFLGSFVVAGFLIFLSPWVPFLFDQSFGVQKTHHGKIPRIGGLAIFFGFFGSFFFLAKQLETSDWIFIKLLSITALPMFLGGLLEDLTKQVSPLSRFILAISSAIIAYFALDSAITSLGFWPVDFLLHYQIVSLLLTSFAVAGVANGANMMDGFHGLLLGYVSCSLLTYAYFSWIFEDQLLFTLCFSLFFACLGLLVFNWPKGKIFLGDGGSYLLGFLLAEIAVLLYNRNQEKISPVAVGIVLSFPVLETLFSIFRRGLKMFYADDRHLHQFIFSAGKKRWKHFSNAWVVVCLLPLFLIPMLVAIAFHRHSLLAILGFFVFSGFYFGIYYRLDKK